jgi:tetratricopeptide (TPR) repeat protein
VFSAAQEVGRDARRVVRELFDLDGDDREFATAADYLERFRALDAGLARCPHAENTEEWIAAVKGSLTIPLAVKERVAEVAASLSKIHYEGILEVLTDGLRQWSMLYPEQVVSIVSHSVRDGRFFPDCPDSKLAYTQLLAAFGEQPIPLCLGLDLFAKFHGDVWLEKGYRKAIELDSKLAAPWTGLGNLFQSHLQRYDEAEAAYRKAIELDGKFAHPWNGLGILLQLHLKRYDEAEAAYRKAIELDGKFAAPWVGLGALSQFQLQHYNEAEAAYRQAFALGEESAVWWKVMGDLLQINLQRYDEAEVAYRKAIELDGKNAYSWHGLGNLLQDHLKRYADAETAYRKAIELDGKFADSWNGLGRLLQDHLKRYDEAEAAYRQAIELDSDDLYPVANLARLLVVTGQPEAAASHYRRVAAMVATGEASAGFGLELVLQAQLWLGNSDAASQALEVLASQAAEGESRAFFLLREQAGECHQLGIGLALAGLMEQGIYADFLKPISLALRATGADGKELLAEAPPEVAILAAEICAEIERYGGA